MFARTRQGERMNSAHPRMPSITKSTAPRATATYRTPLMVLITKVVMVTSRAQQLVVTVSSDEQARATRRQSLIQIRWTSERRADVDDAATFVACVTTGSGECA